MCIACECVCVCQVAHSIRSGGAAVLAQSHFLEMEVKFTSRSVLEGTSSGGARRDTAVAANGSVPSLRPSFHPSRPAGCNSGPLPRSHCEIPHLSSATVASLDSSRASKRSEERGGEDTRKPHEARREKTRSLRAASRQRNYFDEE